MFKNPFKKTPKNEPLYELVESELDPEHFRQGVLMKDSKYMGVIFTVHPMVKMKDNTGQLELLFDYTIETNPSKITLKDSEIRPIIGMILLDMIYKDNYASGITDFEHHLERP